MKLAVLGIGDAQRDPKARLVSCAAVEECPARPTVIAGTLERSQGWAVSARVLARQVADAPGFAHHGYGVLVVGIVGVAAQRYRKARATFRPRHAAAAHLPKRRLAVRLANDAHECVVRQRSEAPRGRLRRGAKTIQEAHPRNRS